MDIMERMMCSIIDWFPDITAEELKIRFDLALHMLELQRFK